MRRIKLVVLPLLLLLASLVTAGCPGKSGEGDRGTQERPSPYRY
jgi:predicted small secreted protein